MASSCHAHSATVLDDVADETRRRRKDGTEGRHEEFPAGAKENLTVREKERDVELAARANELAAAVLSLKMEKMYATRGRIKQLVSR